MAQPSFAARGAVTLLFVVLIGFGACGGGSDNESVADKGGETEASDDGLQVIETLALEDAPFRDELSKAGFEATGYARFPAQQPLYKASTIIYEAKKGERGGVLYVLDKGGDYSVGWHWYFDDAVPEAIQPVELNGDGLWDVRITMKDGSTREEIQEESFTLVTHGRESKIALNGEVSGGTKEGFPQWHCFDGDTTTVWRATAGDDAWVEVKAPLGVRDGILTVKTLDSDQPHNCALVVDGKKVQNLEFSEAKGTQLVRLAEPIESAQSVRLVVESSFGDNGAVAISELEIK